jgi:hypothetical protein
MNIQKIAYMTKNVTQLNQYLTKEMTDLVKDLKIKEP